MVFDLIILGGGPAGVAAGVYAARKRLTTLLITESIGGQSEVSANVQNWIGMASVSGFELAQMFEKHLRAQESIDIQMPEKAKKVLKSGNEFIVETESGATYKSRGLIIATGARRRKLNIPGEEEFNGKGIAYCSTCDAPIFKGKDVVVVGGGNAGLEAVVDLLPYATKIYVLEFSDALRGDTVTLERIKQDEKVEIITSAQALRIEGNKFLEKIVYKDRVTEKEKQLDVGGVFVEIGSVPNSELVKDLVSINKHGEIIIDHKTAATSAEGIWAAGDVTDEIFKQNNISAGDAVKAALSAYSYLSELKRESPASVQVGAAE
ncbi:MAG: hypothetical protein A3C80_01095 [Candidatus Ryanbacteria bacterium RIFCSPHIGHO2_02_FULL_45_43]|uniref:FAD/NAD(P)-binding domain-containing protein n=1 Tax=Candidatus Ryanbacteria bacterium RIFCSPHIGHO2_01_45_13 TaxID=1802112 RepID=A0A1G2FYR9_9BACT|nr:MAG: hypothetical protein A2718_03325 [Candidatus Ryanbacteria bacterium RIFCSPHIGHO2_01_FULL_44_130]OGZ42882.1 MAG: hypothetical protein A2W41_02050 [Candidatus Ryanbacteria bacterium RIFCSPHIGHO2_01_45_13]OGZ48124.1 MAG: hypothetical protein A3C80_01095 [Candidatus Ryanbacteria bacterium RIFCSPHIGHO2_02_FULL_45_43]OGZ49772.1 MAG: hypothetical protein A3E55_00920 [Candidatus Ryanbacteria bacterium RIFCSPHIGHO2_12_FULL_44_20]OGZ51198.1 MAG: hypothetical protein A3A17_04130 [Candidatus Ryanba